MTTILVILGLVAAAVIVGAVVSPSFRQLLRIRTGGAVQSGSTAVERASDRVQQAINNLPKQQQLVAQQMTAADNATAAAQAKHNEVEVIFGKVQLATSANASAATISTLQQQWLTAKNSVGALEQAAVEAHQAAEEAQSTLEEMIQTINESAAGVEQLKSDANLTAILNNNVKVRQQLKDMKSGLGAMAADTKAVKDELSNARNLDKLSHGSKADQEMAAIEKASQGKSAADAFAAELAKRSAPAAAPAATPAAK